MCLVLALSDRQCCVQSDSAALVGVAAAALQNVNEQGATVAP